jgi:hypothetical protein
MGRQTAFSNHTEFELWEVNWCDRCLRDKAYRERDQGYGCPILANVVIDNSIPPEWIEQPFESYPFDAYHCIEFRPPGWRNPEPQPQPPPQPGPGLFPEPERAVRMLIQPQPVREMADA